MSVLIGNIPLFVFHTSSSSTNKSKYWKIIEKDKISGNIGGLLLCSLNGYRFSQTSVVRKTLRSDIRVVYRGWQYVTGKTDKCSIKLYFPIRNLIRFVLFFTSQHMTFFVLSSSQRNCDVNNIILIWIACRKERNCRLRKG